MVERRKKRKRKNDESDYDRMSIPEKPSKEEYAVAKWIRNNVPSKKTKFDRNHIVEYFTGSRAVDALLERSPWNKTIFETRQQVVDFLELMLRHNLFHRAKKIIIKEDELCKSRNIKKKVKDVKEKEKEKDKDKDKDKEKDKEEKKQIDKSKETDVKEKDTEDKKENGEKGEELKEPKKKPKVRLEMHMEQYFVDCNDAYVWIYEPVSIYYWFFGTLLVLAAIGICLFPLWPSTVRHRVWYLSIAAATFLFLIFALIVVRMIVFCLIWVLTLGRHHFLILPNLIEDVGFFASFWPLYKYEYHGPNSDGDKKSLKKKKRKKDKDSGSEDAPITQSDNKSEISEDQMTNDNDKSYYSKASNEDGEEEADEEVGDNTNNVKDKNVKSKEGNEETSDSDKSHTGEDFEMV